MARYLLAAGALGLAALVTPALNAQGGATPGQAAFNDTCAACHQADGKGIEGAFPALAGNAFVQGAPEAVAATVLNGRKDMPSFRGALNDAQIAAILTHVRSSWGNHGGAVTPDLVAHVRAAPPAAVATK